MRKFFTAFFFIAAVVLLIVGITNGQYNDIFRKAAKVCLECVGIG